MMSKTMVLRRSRRTLKYPKPFSFEYFKVFLLCSYRHKGKILQILFNEIIEILKEKKLTENQKNKNIIFNNRRKF